jgi:asparagine synthase (glutamine-hydrolysing)
MSEYLALSWARGMPSSAAERMWTSLEADGDWTLAHQAFELRVYVRGRRPPRLRVLPGGGGVVIGDCFDSQAAWEGRGEDFPVNQLAGLDPVAACEILTRHAWGRYVAILAQPAQPPWIYRDPTGALECLTWTRDAVSIIASSVPVRGPFSPPDLSIDWTALGRLLARGNLCSEICPLAGVTAVDGGVLRHGVGAGDQRRLWRPGDIAACPRPDLVPADLARTIDGVTAALAKDRKVVLAEISGGLDSAIVAASLARCGAPVAAGVNHYWPEPEGDERVFAQVVADRFGYRLIAGERGLLITDPDKLMRHAQGPRPGLNAQDPDLDQDLADQILAADADALFSGQGGDAVLFQMAHPTLAAEILAGARCATGRGAALAQLARRARTTVWRLAGRALSPAGRALPSIPPPSFLGSGLTQPPVHAWLAGPGLSPARRVQTWALVNVLSAFGDSRRSRAAPVLYPLMSQPIIELCLSVPMPTLAIGALDRPFARAAFADRLPAAILARRSKGDVTVFFSRSLAESLPHLRPFLLEGRLTGQGLIDAARLEPLLHAEPLIWKDCVGEVMLAAYLEAWARVWEDRLSAA